VNVHPAAALFPMMGAAELQELAADIKAHGLREPLMTLDGLLLDGRNRLRACELAGVEPRFEEWDGSGGSPTDYVVSLNLHRRHLTKSQWAMIADDLRKLYEAEARKQQGRRTDLSPLTEESLVPTETAARAAEAVGVGTTLVYDAARLKREAPELAEEVRAGNGSIPTALLELRGERRKRVYIKDRHAELIKRARAVNELQGRWDQEMAATIAPPEARKQLTVLRKAADLLAEAIEAVEYRAATLDTFARR
jgi:hypothetical protein